MFNQWSKNQFRGLIFSSTDNISFLQPTNLNGSSYNQVTKLNLIIDWLAFMKKSKWASLPSARHFRVTFRFHENKISFWGQGYGWKVRCTFAEFHLIWGRQICHDAHNCHDWSLNGLRLLMGFDHTWGRQISKLVLHMWEEKRDKFYATFGTSLFRKLALAILIIEVDRVTLLRLPNNPWIGLKLRVPLYFHKLAKNLNNLNLKVMSNKN